MKITKWLADKVDDAAERQLDRNATETVELPSGATARVFIPGQPRDTSPTPRR